MKRTRSRAAALDPMLCSGPAAVDACVRAGARHGLSRRQFLQTTASALTFAATIHSLQAAYPKLKLGVTDWNLKLEAKPTAVEFAKSIGFDGVEISLGRAPAG